MMSARLHPEDTMTVDDIPLAAEYLIRKYGLDTQGWTFQWDRAKRRAGCCKYGKKIISLSIHYVRLNIADHLDDILDTILHEIAHALAGPGAGHGKKWKAECARVGATPKRCYDSSKVDMPFGKYMAICKGCGKTFFRHKNVKKGTYRYCLACGPQVGILVYRNMLKAAGLRGTPPQPRRLRGEE